MASDKEIRVAIVGFGGIGEHHAKVVKEIPSATLVAAADVVETRLHVAKEKYGVEGYLDYHDLLARDEIDVVDICTPSGLHGEVAVAAARAKKHIVTEKPIEVTLAKADAMIQAARENGVGLAVIFQNRFTASAQQAKRLLEEGRLGTIFLADAYVKWHRTQEYYDSGLKWRGTLALDGGGAVINQSVHYVDLLQWFVGPVASVFAHKATVAHKIEGEDVAVGVLRFENGAMGVVEGSTACYPGFEARIELHGSEGSLIWAGGSIQRLEIMGEEAKAVSDVQAKHGEVQADPLALSLGPHFVQLQAFFAAIREGRAPEVQPEEARKALEIITALYRSAETGQVVALPLRE